MDEKKETTQMVLHAAPDLGFNFYDMFNIHVGPEEVVLEFGNHNRFKPGEATVMHRAVLSPSNAIKMQQSLQQTLMEMQAKLREQMTEAETDKLS